MSDLQSLLRDHYEEIAPPIDVERLADRLLTEERLQPTPSRSRGVLVAVAAALVVLLVVGGTTLLISLTEREVIEEPPSTTMVPQTTVPDEPAPVDPPGPDESALPTVADVGMPFTTLDLKGNVGSGASVIVGDDGIPLVAYAYHPVHSDEPSEIRLATCADSACAEAGDVVTIAEVHQPARPPEERGRVAVEIQVLLPDDGLPIVIWSEWEDVESGGMNYLRAYKCADPTCSAGTLTGIDTVERNNLWAAVGPDSLPLIAWSIGDWRNVTIHTAKCSDPGCEGPVEAALVDIPMASYPVAVTVDANNRPVIATSLAEDEEVVPSLSVVRCNDPLCAGPPEIADTGVEIRELSAITVDSADRPITLAAGPEVGMASPDRIVLVSCVDPACAESPVVTPMITPTSERGDIDPFGSLAVADDGSVAVLNGSGGVVRVVTCTEPTCESGPTDVAVIPDVGGWPDADLALDANGYPVLAIHANTDLGVFVCSEPTCAADQVPVLSDAPGANWATTIAAPGDVSFNGMNPSIEIGPDGYPVIGYAGLSTNRGPEGEPITVPKLLVCDDAGCATSTTRELADDAWWISMTLLPDGRPVAAYSAWSEESEIDELFVVWCSDPGCNTWTTEKIAESGWTNSTVPLVAHPDGSVTVIFQNGDDYYVYLVTCSEGACEGAEAMKIDSLVDPSDNEWGTRWWMNTLDVALLPDGRPVIAAAQDNGELRYVECLDTTCSDSHRITIGSLFDANGTVEVGSSGLPILAYYDDGELIVTACHDTSCSDTTTTTIGEASASFMAQVTASVAFGSDGNPMIAYWAPRALMVAECHDPLCARSTVDVFAAVRTYDLAVLPNGSPVLSYFAHSAEEPPSGEEEFDQLVDLRVAECTSGTCIGD
ncbi:MAG: hypothetical protein ABFS21_08920 [Actinomycetota bacterium]